MTPFIQARSLLFLQVLLLLVSIGVSAQSIKNTKKFLSYFNGIDNMVSYKKLKENIESTGAKVGASADINDSNKNVLKELYNLVKEKSDSLVDKLTSDLLSKVEPKKMVKDPEAYVNSLNGIFGEIKTANTGFIDKYAEIAGGSRGNRSAFNVKDFDLPLDKLFDDEVITAVLKALVKSQVRKKISLKSWDDLT
jgi:hypothetical protein